MTGRSTGMGWRLVRRRLVAWVALATLSGSGLAQPVTAPAAATTAAAVAQPAFDCAAFRAYPGPPGLRKLFQLLPDAATTIQAATLVAAKDGLPEYCKVEGYAGGTVGFEVRLPTRTWNGKFLQQGCGAMCGIVSLASCEDVLARNYAVVSTDMGHKSTAGDVKWARHNRQAQIDFGYRATHVATLAAKAIVGVYYGRAPTHAYFRGCSTGGRQAMVEAQRYPDDYDGIIAGAPPLDETGDALLHLIWTGRATYDATGAQVLDASRLPLIHQSVMAACDRLDGLADGIIQDPTACGWKPESLRCKAGASTDTCLNDAEVASLQKIYGGAHDSKGRKLYAGGLPLGSEHDWATQLVAAKGQQPGYLFDNGFIAELMRNLAFDDPLPVDWPLVQLDFDKDPQRLATMEALYNAQNPDLTKFKARGGKLIMWHGWDDIEIPATVSVEYYQKVEGLMGGARATEDFFRLYLVPGVAHCRRGPGADAFDELSYLEAWVEKGVAPDVLTAYHLKKEQNYFGLPRPVFPMDPALSDWSRPVFPYPYYAKYKGSGDPKDAGSWLKARLTIAGPPGR